MKRIISFMLVIVLCLGITSCGILDSATLKLQESITGVKFKITVYDAYGNNSLTKVGGNIKIGLEENWANKSADSNGFKSEVLRITIDGSTWNHVGSSLIAASPGIDTIQDFDYEYLKKLKSEGHSTGFIPLDRVINDYGNMVGKEKLIVVKSQFGIPIGIYQGNNVRVEIPDDLPKTTRLIIDGQLMYIYRCDYEIMDAALIQ
ncbi:MAG: DUF5052 family protein [Clostridia bacterium]|nr:DUF5052 family protein [Clostridia bacterium]